MRVKSLAACVAILVCLTAPAWAATWDGSDGLLWSNGDNWTPAGVPDAEDAIINNGLLGSPTLNSVSNITNLEVSGFSTLNIEAGADLTASGSGSIAASGASDEGYVNHTNGAVSFGTDLTLGGAGIDFGRWTMSSSGTLGVTNDLIVGDSGTGQFDLEGTSGLTVNGSIDIGKSTGGNGTMSLSGSATLDQTGGALNVGGSGTGGVFSVEGDTPVINVTNYDQAFTGSLNLVLNDFGIATINASGTMTLAGSLNVSVAGGASPAPDVYDIIAAQGARTGAFNAVNLPDGVALRYEDGTGSAAKLYVGIEPPAAESNYQLIDTFDAGGYEINESGNPAASGPNQYNFADAGIIGGSRQMYARDGHSGTIGNPTAFTLDDAAGTLEWWGGATAPDIKVHYGSAINSDWPGWATQPHQVATGTPVDLNLSKIIGIDNIQIDVVQGTPAGRDDGRLTVTLFTGAGRVSWTSPSQEVAGTTIIELSDFAGITAAHVADIDGIRVQSSASYSGAPTAKGEGIIISEVRFGDPAGTGPVVPEPAGLGLVGLALLAVRRRRS